MAYDSDCDDLSLAKAVLMANLSSCYLEVLLCDSNIIWYSQYLQESQDAVIQDTNSSAPNDLLGLSLVEQITDHVAYFRFRKNQTINCVIVKEHVVLSVIDDEVTLILEEKSRSKMLDKQNDLISLKQKINISPIDYSKLNKIKEDFGKRFVTQKELFAEQAFWLKHSNYNLDTYVKPHTPVRIEAPSELPKLSIDNDQLLKQIMSQEIVHIAVNSVDILDVKKSCVKKCNKCLELETKLLKKKDLIEKDVYDILLKSYSTHEKHYISLELTTQLNQESQANDIVIEKLKERIKYLSGKDNVEKVKKDIDEIETINIELEHSVAKLLSKNENLRKEREHLKSIYKDQFDSIRKTRVQSKEHCDSLIAQINAKSIENSDLNAQLQEKVFAVAALKNELRKLKGKMLSILLFQNLVPLLLQECSS
ncbi:hypothetical protein Tco_0740021 [Tanacetum coccineum]